VVLDFQTLTAPAKQLVSTLLIQLSAVKRLPSCADGTHNSPNVLASRQCWMASCELLIQGVGSR